MIVAKTNMKKIPATCKDCKFKTTYFQGYLSCGATCDLTGRECHTEKKPSGNVGYGMPSWCPLMDIELIKESENEADTKNK